MFAEWRAKRRAAAQRRQDYDLLKHHLHSYAKWIRKHATLDDRIEYDAFGICWRLSVPREYVQADGTFCIVAYCDDEKRETWFRVRR